MKNYTFYRENNHFDDILNNANVKSMIKLKIKWNKHLVIGIDNGDTDSVHSYITLMYSDDLVTVSRDFKPIPGIDYTPKKDSSKFTKKRN